MRILMTYFLDLHVLSFRAGIGHLFVYVSLPMYKMEYDQFQERSKFNFWQTMRGIHWFIVYSKKNNFASANCTRKNVRMYKNLYVVRSLPTILLSSTRKLLFLFLTSVIYPLSEKIYFSLLCKWGIYSLFWWHLFHWSTVVMRDERVIHSSLSSRGSDQWDGLN